MTTIAESQSLLQEFVTHRSQAAFRRLVEIHTRLVYSAALRVVAGNVHMAQDVAQATFLSLAQKAGKLPPTVILPTWLYRHAHLTARRFLRTEGRRRAREEAA